MNKGQLQIDYWVSCAIKDCHNYADGLGHTVKESAIIAKNRGWSYNKETGWLCPWHSVKPAKDTK